MKYIKQIILLLITWSISINAVIPEMEIWADKDNQHFRYLLKDIHVDYKGAKNTIKQQEDILWALQQNKNTSFIIVEDSLSPYRQYLIELQLKTENTTNLTFPSCLQEYINSQQWSQEGLTVAQNQEQQLYWASPLQFLAHFCQKTDLPTYNVECETIIGIYENKKFDNEQEHQQEQQVVYNNLYAYTNNLRNNSPLKPYCDLLDKKFEYLQSVIGKSNQNTFTAIAGAIRYILLEAHMLYQLNTWKEIKHGYVVTGADHINRIKQNLPILGYRHLKTIGIPTEKYISEEIIDQKNNIIHKEAIYISDSEAASNPLDLQKTFTEIFNEQKPLWQKAICYLASVWMKIR